MADNIPNDQALSSKDLLIHHLELKNDYINDLAQAIDDHDDLKIYQLIGPLRYKAEITDSYKNKYGDHPFDLVKDQREEVAHFLSDNLIDYLAEKFPFFYYHEVSRGQFTVFFGNWWDRREFGTLDVLNVEFNFKADELDKLEQVLKIEDDKTINSDEIVKLSEENENLQNHLTDADKRSKKREELVKQQSELSDKGGLFESGKLKEERQDIANQIAELDKLDEVSGSAPQTIKDNQNKILALSKEDTTLGYEKDALTHTFKTFESFQNHVKRLYVDYLSSLIGKGSVKNNG
ncbi:hypothetical protein [Pediococcus argentinicus]|uniref:Exonuclease SbcC n=1 Tax=Pediococcus argentinicus TaxID=480391 RepID=A0A0R2NHX2_9LACO|nr:hypothetical protein [Pediococcus argentinicus]KRO25397.1 hypothetical protein IV88_GL000234 [Pediococcus argentinicus]NKZ22315.1 hypothetical protein [Pediococcus argentinicus]GEP19320.1 hypothetical protein LSA03_07040 [Pediococcus argentinicus]